MPRKLLINKHSINTINTASTTYTAYTASATSEQKGLQAYGAILHKKGFTYKYIVFWASGAKGGDLMDG